MGIGEDEFFEALANPIRRRIIELLYDRVELSHKELMEELGVSSGLLNFHLRKLDGLIAKTERGTYTLTPEGAAAYRIMREARRRLGEPHDALGGVDAGLALRRALAALIDVAAIFTATGALLDPQLLSLAASALSHLPSLLQGHPWMFHADHAAELGSLVARLVAAYSHVFFALFIILTLMEAYKGQTLGKYVMGIRVVKRSGRRLDLTEAAIRNAGKVFLLPIDLALGLLVLRKGYLRYTDYYVDAVVVRVERG